jgi:hypothetical protein
LLSEAEQVDVSHAVFVRLAASFFPSRLAASLTNIEKTVLQSLQESSTLILPMGPLFAGLGGFSKQKNRCAQLGSDTCKALA